MRLAGVATVDVYVSGRFVEHFASMNRLGFATLQLSDDASIQHVCEHICVMSICRHDFARRKKHGFDQAFFSRHIGKNFRHQRCFFCNMAICVGIPMMSISHSDLMPIRAERSDAGLSQFETVIDIRQWNWRFSLS